MLYPFCVWVLVNRLLFLRFSFKHACSSGNTSKQKLLCVSSMAALLQKLSAVISAQNPWCLFSLSPAGVLPQCHGSVEV